MADRPRRVKRRERLVIFSVATATLATSFSSIILFGITL